MSELQSTDSSISTLHDNVTENVLELQSTDSLTPAQQVDVKGKFLVELIFFSFY